MSNHISSFSLWSDVIKNRWLHQSAPPCPSLSHSFEAAAVVTTEVSGPLSQ